MHKFNKNQGFSLSDKFYPKKEKKLLFWGEFIISLLWPDVYYSSSKKDKFSDITEEFETAYFSNLFRKASKHIRNEK